VGGYAKDECRGTGRKNNTFGVYGGIGVANAKDRGVPTGTAISLATLWDKGIILAKTAMRKRSSSWGYRGVPLFGTTKLLGFREDFF
jgi:hypothetical protein